MKISGNIARINRHNIACTTGKVIASADRRIAAAAPDGTSKFCIVAPKGIDYVPQAEDDSVVISAKNEHLCIGVRRADNHYEIAPGELALYSLGGAYIILKNNGSVIINGTEYPNGEGS